MSGGAESIADRPASGRAGDRSEVQGDEDETSLAPSPNVAMTSGGATASIVELGDEDRAARSQHRGGEEPGRLTPNGLPGSGA